MEFEISKRRFYRVKLNVVVNIDKIHSGTTKDISLGGICLQTQLALELNRYIKLQIQISEKDVINPIGKVQWSKETENGYISGIEFWEIQYKDKLLLQTKVQELISASQKSVKQNSIYKIDNKIKETEDFLNDISAFINESEEVLAQSESQEKIFSPDTRQNHINSKDVIQMIIKIPEDKMSATADFYPRQDNSLMDKNEIIELINLHKIKTDILWNNIDEALDKIILERNEISNVLISQGIPPIPEVPEYVKIKPALLKTNKSKEWQDEKIDYKEISPYTHVVKDEEVAIIIVKEEGHWGKNVEGKEIPYKIKEAPVINVLNNLEIIDNSIKSLCFGNFHFENNDIFVNKVLNIVGDVDYSTGNIKFLGDINVQGGIREGFKLICGGSLFCGKTIEVSEIFVQKDLVCQSGIIGRKNSSLRVGGNIWAKFIEKCHIECRGNIYAEKAIVNSQINSLDSIKLGKTGRIQSSQIIARNMVYCQQIGSPGGVETSINLGIDFIVNKRILMIKEKSEKLFKFLESLENKKNQNDQKKLLVKNNILKGISDLEDLLGNLLSLLHKNEEAQLQVTGKIYPVLVLSICHVSKKFKENTNKCIYGLNKKKGIIEAKNFLNKKQ